MMPFTTGVKKIRTCKFVSIKSVDRIFSLLIVKITKVSNPLNVSFNKDVCGYVDKGVRWKCIRKEFPGVVLSDNQRKRDCFSWMSS